MTHAKSDGVLLVDPTPDESRRLKRSLEACGWRVWVAADLPAVRQVYAARGREIGAVIVDLRLPGLQGARVLAELGELTPSLVRLAMGADLPTHAVAAFRRLTPTPLFPKPVRVEELDRLLRASLAATA